MCSFQIADPIFHAANFNKLPIKLIEIVLNHSYQALHRETNANSISTAKLALVVCSALGNKGSKIKLEHFLPYEMKENNGRLKESTRKAMQWALKNEKLPAVVVGMIGAELR